MIVIVRLPDRELSKKGKALGSQKYRHEFRKKENWTGDLPTKVNDFDLGFAMLIDKHLYEFSKISGLVGNRWSIRNTLTGYPPIL